MSYPLQEPTIREVQTLQQEIADTRKKLQEYADTIVSLHGELRTLRDSICSTCKRKFVLTNPISSQAAEPVADSASANRIPPSQHTNSKISSRPLLKAHASDFSTTGAPIHRSTTTHASQTFPFMPQPLTTIHGSGSKSASNSNPLTTASLSRAITPKTVPIAPCWSIKRDAAASATLDVTFVCTFNHKDSLAVRSVRFSADGKYLAAALSEWHNNGTIIIIYDVEAGKKTCVLKEYASQYSSNARLGIHCACFSPDCRYLVVGNREHSITVWDIPNNRIRNRFGDPEVYIESVDFSPDSRFVVSTDWGIVRIWNMRDGSAKVFTGHYNGRGPYAIRFSPNGRYVVVGTSGDQRMWDVRTGRLVQRWTTDKSHFRCVAFMPDGRGLVSGGGDGVVKRWDVSSLGIVQSDGEPVTAKTLEYKGHTSRVYAIAVSPDAQWIASTSFDKTAILWDARNAVRQYTLMGHGDVVSSADFSPAGTYLATGSSDGHVTLWRYSRT